MMDSYIDKFLVNYRQNNVERHSDSSDFDEIKTPFISPRSGKQSSLDKNLQKHAKAKEKLGLNLHNNSVCNKEHTHRTMSDENMIPVRDHDVNIYQHRNKVHQQINTNSKINVVPHYSQTLDNSTEIQYKPTVCFSSHLRHPNLTEQISSIKNVPDDALNSGKTICADCERRQNKKFNRRRQSYVVQPVCGVDNVQGGPVSFGHANDQAPLSQHNHKVVRKQESNISYELTSSESEIGKIDRRKHVSRRRYFIERFQKEMRKEYLKYEKELLRNRIQQYPSKRSYHFPYQVFSTPFCQADNRTRDSDQGNVPPTTSGFWEYFFEKVRGKHQNLPPKSCGCKSSPLQQQQQQSAANCPDDLAPSKAIDTKPSEMAECKSCIRQTEDPVTDSLGNQPKKKKKSLCKCHCSQKRKQPQKTVTETDEVTRPCQEPHDKLVKSIEEKYQGEVLCIHNPPCILINGCLNLPYTKDQLSNQENVWPVTQEKRSSFYHICRRMIRSKHNHCEQASQYHPPNIEVQQALQIKMEKVVQSICNHDPPCEVVYGCYKPKYDPRLENSCVHVPMCQRMPVCLIDERQELNMDKLCEHKPKCAEVPLCSRKLIVLTARETVGTQVRPKTKVMCRHEPPCIMIPKCFGRIISDGCLPYEAIPDCVHQPCCEMIPACCRRSTKPMVSVSSQYPNAACRIV